MARYDARMPADEIDLTPTAEMAANAERGLRLREKHGRGGTEVGVARARDLKNRKTLSPDTVRRMHSFFARHAGNEAGGEDDAGYIAFLLWGGAEGKAWAARKVGQLDKKDTNMKNGKKAAMMREYVLWGFPPTVAKDETDRLHEKPVAWNMYTPAAVEKAKKEALAKGWHGLRVDATELHSRPGAKAAFGTPDEALTVFTTLAEAEKASINGNRAKAKQLLQSIAALIARDRSKLPAGAVAFYEEMKAKVGMSRLGAKVAFGDDKALEAFLKKWKRNEADNAHTENVVMLARFVGSSDEIAEARDIQRQHDALGHLPSALNTQRYALYKNLKSKLLARYPNAAFSRPGAKAAMAKRYDAKIVGNELIRSDGRIYKITDRKPSKPNAREMLGEVEWLFIVGANGAQYGVQRFDDGGYRVFGGNRGMGVQWDGLLRASRPGAKSTHAADDAVSKKIATLIREGYPRDQAVAIAYDMKRRGEI